MKISRPNTIEELNLILAKDKNYAFISGGTDLVASIKKGLEKREDFIDLSLLKSELRKIEENDENITIKAMSTFNDIQKNESIKKYFPMLIETAKTIGGFTIQNMATIAGNIANASPAADSLPVLLVLDSTVVLNGPNGKREVKIDKFYKGYKNLEMKNNEFIEAIIIPKKSYKESFFKEVGTRRAVSISKIALAYTVEESGKVRIASGSVAAYPTRLYNTENYLEKELTTDLLETIKTDITPIDDIRSTGDYRLNVVKNIIESLI